MPNKKADDDVDSIAFRTSEVEHINLKIDQP